MSTVVFIILTALNVAAGSADLSATCSSLDADQQGACSRQRQGHAMLQVRSSDGALRSAVVTPSTKLIDNLFGGAHGKRMGFDLALIERALRKNETETLLQDKNGEPGGDLAEWVKTQLLPQAEMTKVELQGEVNRALKAVDSCSKLNWHAEKSQAHRERLLASDEGEKYQCIATEHQMSIEERKACNAVDAFAAKAVQPATLKDTDLSDREAIKAALKENRDFFKGAYPQYDGLSQECEKAALALANQQKVCEVDEETVREFYCHMKAGRDKACVGYESCYDEKKSIYDKTILHAHALETENKDHFRKLACSSFGGHGSSTCQASMNTDNLDVAYPSDRHLSIHGKCMEVAKTKYDYSDIRCNADGTVDNGEHEDEEDEVEEEGNSTKPASNATAAEPAKEEEESKPASNATKPASNATELVQRNGKKLK